MRQVGRQSVVAWTPHLSALCATWSGSWWNRCQLLLPRFNSCIRRRDWLECREPRKAAERRIDGE